MSVYFGCVDVTSKMTCFRAQGRLGLEKNKLVKRIYENKYNRVAFTAADGLQ